MDGEIHNRHKSREDIDDDVDDKEKSVEENDKKREKRERLDEKKFQLTGMEICVDCLIIIGNGKLMHATRPVSTATKGKLSMAYVAMGATRGTYMNTATDRW